MSAIMPFPPPPTRHPSEPANHHLLGFPFPDQPANLEYLVDGDDEQPWMFGDMLRGRFNRGEES